MRPRDIYKPNVRREADGIGWHATAQVRGKGEITVFGGSPGEALNRFDEMVIKGPPKPLCNYNARLVIEFREPFLDALKTHGPMNTRMIQQTLHNPEGETPNGVVIRMIGRQLKRQGLVDWDKPRHNDCGGSIYRLTKQANTAGDSCTLITAKLPTQVNVV
jgi:hypothetical protein